MTFIFNIQGRLPGLNEYTAANRTNPHKGNKMKHDAETLIMYSIRNQLRGLHIDNLINIHYTFVEPNTKRDKDNIASFAMKVIQDSLVKCGVIENDGWKNINGFTCSYSVDKGNPHIMVQLEEVE